MAIIPILYKEPVFHLAGHDEEVRRAESRLIAIAVLHSGLGKSDRRSIQAILVTALQRLTFAESGQMCEPHALIFLS